MYIGLQDEKMRNMTIMNRLYINLAQDTITIKKSYNNSGHDCWVSLTTISMIHIMNSMDYFASLEFTIKAILSKKVWLITSCHERVSQKRIISISQFIAEHMKCSHHNSFYMYMYIMTCLCSYIRTIHELQNMYWQFRYN